MRLFLTLAFGLLVGTTFAQDGSMEGIDAFFMEDGFFDNVADAKAIPSEVFYLDLSLQSPKLKSIPEEVYSFVNLKYLEIGFNQVGSISEDILKLSKLEVLGLSGNKYLKTVSEKIAQMPALKEIHLKDTGLSADQLNGLKLPEGCKLVK